MMMPNVDGFIRCASGSPNPKTQNLPVIFLSAMDEAMDKFRGFQLAGGLYHSSRFLGRRVLARVITIL